MTEARTQILANIRSALTGGEPRTPLRMNELKARIESSTPKAQPQFEDELLNRFCQKHVAVHGTYERVTAQDLEGGVLRHIGAHQVDPQLYLGAGPLLDAVQWSAQVFTYFKSADQHTQVAVSEAFAAIAETGTVVLCSGPSTPTSHNFLPEDHIVVVDSARIVRHQEDVWTLLRNREDAAVRVVNLITGPSKTGDIEQTIQYGAHGPRRLHLLIVELA